jgi:glycosyltransferase involved in cell wall biosynthesis
MRVLYVSQTGMTEPLGQSQVVPYLVGLARAGFDIDIVTFEPEDAGADTIARVRAQLCDHGIGYAWLPRRRAHDVATKAREAASALLRLIPLALARRPQLVHARATIAAAVAHLTARLVPGARMLFDCRGLVADEYVDFGHWERGSFRYRLLKTAEMQLFRRADALVVLTDRLRRWLRDEAQLVAARTPIEVIPCCVDVARFAADDETRRRARAEVGAGDRFVLAYAGNLNAWYCDEQMAELFAAIRRRRPALFTIYSRAPSQRLREALARRGVADAEVRVAAVPPDEMPRALAAADAAISFAEPRFSKIASSPVKVAEYLAVGLPVAVNRGVGDQDALVDAEPSLLVDAGDMREPELDAAAGALVTAAADPSTRRRARALAGRQFSLDTIGVARYRALYERLAS